MSLKFLLDTNICIYLAKKNEDVLENFSRVVVGEVAMSTITYGELIYGAEKSQHRQLNLNRLSELVHLVPPLPLPTDVGDFYGKIRAELEKKAALIGNNDLWIAAHCLSLEVTLVTNNIKEFKRVKGLDLENWVS